MTPPPSPSTGLCRPTALVPTALVPTAPVPATLVPAALAAALSAALLAACGPAPDEPIKRWQVDGADTVRGRLLMAQYQCGSCHAVPGVPGGGQRAPALDRFSRRSYIAGQLPNTPETLERWLLDPPGQVPGTTMPRLGLSDRDARDIAGYLLSLR